MHFNRNCMFSIKNAKNWGKCAINSIMLRRKTINGALYMSACCFGASNESLDPNEGGEV